MQVKLKVKVENVEPGKIQGQMIARATSKSNTVTFDVIEGLMSISEGDRLTVEVRDTPPKSLDSYEFCGHGYKVPRKGGEGEIISLWGILFVFEPEIGLEEGKKYYVCLSKQRAKRPKTAKRPAQAK